MPVKDLYTGPMFVYGLQYAIRHKADRILVIGDICKSKVFELDDIIETYEGIDIKKLKQPERKMLAKERLANIIAKGCSAKDDNFVFLTGQSYYEFILANRPNALPEALQHYELPFLKHECRGNVNIIDFLKNN